jgi:hypothetical protein
MNDVPYRFLQLSRDPLIDTYKQDRNLTQTFTYADVGCKLLKPEITEFFISRKLFPEIGNLWARPPNLLPDFYHTDRIKIKGKSNIEVAINWLLAGEPGLTQWSYAALEHKIVSKVYGFNNIPTEYYSQNASPEFTTVLNRPMLTRIDVPHIINTIGTSTVRLSYSLRFKDDPTWEYCLEQLKDIILAEDLN